MSRKCDVEGRCSAALEGSKTAIDISPVFNSEHNDLNTLALDRVQDHVVFARVDATDMRISHKLTGAGAPWIFAQQIKPPLHSLLNMRWQLSQRTIGGIGEDHLVPHL